jgi:hypothetical protein
MAANLDLVFDVLLGSFSLDRRRRASRLSGLGVVSLGLDGLSCVLAKLD